MTTTNKQESGPKTGQPEREPRVEAEIGCRLKAYYADILSQPIPDRLLQALKAAQEQSPVVKADRKLIDRRMAAFCMDRSRPRRRPAFLAAMQRKR
jgi:hypothetical protein